MSQKLQDAKKKRKYHRQKRADNLKKGSHKSAAKRAQLKNNNKEDREVDGFIRYLCWKGSNKFGVEYEGGRGNPHSTVGP